MASKWEKLRWAGLVADLMPVGLLGVDGVLQVAGGGQNAGVDDQGAAMGLGGLVVVVRGANCAPVGEEDEAAEVVGRLAPVELAADPTTEGLVGEPAQGVESAQQLAVLQHGLGQGVLSGAGLQLGDEQRRRDVAQLEGATDADQIVGDNPDVRCPLRR